MTIALSKEILDRLWPHAIAGLTAGMAQTSEAVFAKYGIVTLADLTDFMAEISEETAGGIAIEENLEYSAARACQVWPSLFPTVASAQPYAFNPKALADKTYGGRYGNRPGTDDGYDFRGRGAIQITFHDWYQKIGAATGLDLLGKPDLVNDPLHFLECSAAYWKLDDVSALANAGNFQAEVLRVNGGTTNMAARLSWRAIWQKALAGVDASAVAVAPAASVTKPSEAAIAAVAPPPEATTPAQDLQKALNRLGASPPLTVDGQIGGRTIAAMQAVIQKAA